MHPIPRTRERPEGAGPGAVRAHRGVRRDQSSTLFEPRVTVSLRVRVSLFESVLDSLEVTMLVQFSACVWAVIGATRPVTAPATPAVLSPPVRSWSTSGPSWPNAQSLPTLPAGAGGAGRGAGGCGV